MSAVKEEWVNVAAHSLPDWQVILCRGPTNRVECRGVSLHPNNDGVYRHTWASGATLELKPNWSYFDYPGEKIAEYFFEFIVLKIPK